MRGTYLVLYICIHIYIYTMYILFIYIYYVYYIYLYVSIVKHVISEPSPVILGVPKTYVISHGGLSKTGNLRLQKKYVRSDDNQNMVYEITCLLIYD